MDNLLTTITEYMKYAPGVDASLTIDNLRPSNINARKTIRSVLSTEVFDVINKLETTDEKRIALCGSLANLTMYGYKVFEAVNKRIDQGKEIYRYELDAMRREYINNHFTYIDTLIGLLEEDEKFKQSPLYLLKEKLIIKSLDQFESFYPIDGSYYFFYRTLTLQRDVIENKIYTRVNVEEALKNEKHKKKLEKATVLLTIAKSFEMFDVYELPANIKNTGSANRISTDKLYDEKWKSERIISLEKEAFSLIDTLERVQSAIKMDRASINNEFDKTFLL